MLNPKYNYEKLSRTNEEGQRLYKTPDGNKLPSVTTVLTATQPAKKVQALKEWRDRVGHERAATITNQAANRGTRVHSLLEDYVNNGELRPRGSNPFSWVSHSMAELIVQEGLKNFSEFWGTEVSLYFPKLYAGTADGVGVHLGAEAIFDYKQTNKEKKEEWVDDYKIQTVFYATAHNEVHGTNIKKGVILMAVKPKTDVNGIMIEEPRYQEFIVEGSEWLKYENLMWSRLEQYYSNSTIHPR